MDVETYANNFYENKKTELVLENGRLKEALISVNSFFKQITLAEIEKPVGKFCYQRPGLRGGSPTKTIKIHYHVNNNNFDIWTFDVDSTAKVGDIKMEIFKAKKVPASIIVLKYMNAVVANNQALSGLPSRGEIIFFMEIESTAKHNQEILEICGNLDTLYREEIKELERVNLEYKTALRNAQQKINQLKENANQLIENANSMSLEATKASDDINALLN